MPLCCMCQLGSRPALLAYCPVKCATLAMVDCLRGCPCPTPCRPTPPLHLKANQHSHSTSAIHSKRDLAMIGRDQIMRDHTGNVKV